MKKLVAVGLLLGASAAQADFIAPGFFAAGFVETGFFVEDGAGQVAVPDVVGEASFAAADAILEGDGLDGFEVATCSSAAMDEVIGQAPTDGVLVDLGTVVVVYVSSGNPCLGRPPLWLWLEADR